MHRATLFTTLITLSLLINSTASWAQAFFGPAPKNQTNTAALSSSSSTPKVLSPSEFKNQVNSLNKQTNDRLNQAVNKEIANAVPPPSPAATLTPPPAPSTAGASGLTNNSSSSVINNASPPITPALPPNSTASKTKPVISAPPSISQNPPPPAQANVYSGFGAGNASGTNNNTNNDASNWNIKY